MLFYRFSEVAVKTTDYVHGHEIDNEIDAQK